MGLKENWWRLNYHFVRLVAIPVAKQILRVNIRSEGTIPDTRPLFLAPVHRSSVDIYAMANVTREFISFVSTDAYGHSRFVNYVQRHATRALGSVVWQQSGIANTRHRAVALAHDVDDRLDRRLIVAAFTQGEFQLHSVEAVEDGLIGLLRRYEVRHLKQTGRELRIPVVPVGIEYENDGKGLQLSGVMRWLAANVPKFPDWSVPAAGSKIVVRFGKPLYFEGRSPHELTDVAMREAAALSDIPYNVSR